MQRMWKSLQMETYSTATHTIGVWKGTPVSVSLLSTKIKTEMQLEAAYFM